MITITLTLNRQPQTLRCIRAHVMLERERALFYAFGMLGNTSLFYPSL